MFRELVRKKQQISQEECISILKAEPRGVRSVLGDDGYPYGMPLNHYYEEEGHAKVLEECYRILRPGGLLIVSENVEPTYSDVVDSGFLYSDHNPVEMRFKLKK